MENEQNIPNIEEQIFSQIKSYKDSQDNLASLIDSNIDAEELLQLYLINDEWFDKWKKFTCYDEIKFNHPLNNIKKLKEIRLQKKADEVILPTINNKNLFLENNNNDFTLKKNSINPFANFHLLTKECYKKLCHGKKRDIKVRFNFEIKTGKIMAKFSDKIIILYKNESKLNLILLIFKNMNFLNEKYEELKVVEAIDFLLNIGVNPNCEKQDVNISNNKIIFINKSCSKVKEEEDKFKNVISSLINHEFIFFPMLKSSGINNLNLYLINDNWLLNFKKSIKYLDTINKTGLSGANQAETINKIFEAYKNNSFSIKNEIINEENTLYNYLKENNTGNYIKLYSDYTLITEELWLNLIQFFKWNIEIKVNSYIIKKHTIIIYNENDFEIYEVLDSKKINNIFFHVFDSAKTDQVVNDIKNMGIIEYYNKYNINASQENQIYFKLFDNMNNLVGFAININAAINNFNEFSFMIQDQIDEKDLNELHIGYNAKNNNMPNLDNNNNININNNNPNNFQNSFNNMNFINNVGNLNNQFNNMNLNNMNNKNMNMNNINPNEVDITQKVINQVQNPNNIIQTQNIIITEQNNNNQSDTTLNFLKANSPNFNNIIYTNIQYDFNMNNNNNINNNNNMNNNMNNIQSANPIRRSNTSNININGFNNGISSEINPPLQHAISFENSIIPNNNLQNQIMPKVDILKTIVLCLSNCDVLFQNIININEDPKIMPIISSLKYIFQNADYTNGINKLRENLNRASKEIVNLEKPKNIFIFILDNINNEIGGGFNPNQSNSSFLSKKSNNKNNLYEDFVNQIFNPINTTFISKNFFGIREVITKCNTCRYENYNLDIFRFLEFSVEEVQKFLVDKLPDYIQGEKSNAQRFLEINNNNAKNIITLNDCFDCYSNNITEMNNIIINCKNCKEKSDHPKGKFGLKKMPNILCILIENKKDYKVSLKLQEKLNVGKYVNPDTIKEYYLVSAIIKSSGNDSYNALIKNMNDNKWYLNLEYNSVPFDIKTEKQEGKPFLLIYKAK